MSREIWSFFSGAMGLDLGLEREGLAPTLAIDHDKWCLATVRENRPNLDLLAADVEDLDGPCLGEHRQLGGDDEVFLVVGGPPCQTFCPGGTRAGLKDPRGNLIYAYLGLIAQIRPRYFVLENVANLVTVALRHRPIKERPGEHWSLKRYAGRRVPVEDGKRPLEADEQSGSAIRQVLEDVTALGYQVEFGVLDAADFGAPQHRHRFVLIGSRAKRLDGMPRPTHGPHAEHPYRTLRETIADLHHDPGPHSAYTQEVARWFELVPPGGNWRHLPEELKPQAMGNSYASGGGKTGFYRRLAWDAPAPTITGRANRKGSALCHPVATRPLSVSECARLQGFPDDWKFSGAMAQQYQQVGNAVPVPLGRAIARHILEVDAGREPADTSPDWPRIELMLDRAVTALRATARNKKSRRSPEAETLPLFG